MFSNNDCGNDLSNTGDCGNHLMGGWYGTPWMWLSMLVFLALLIGFVYYAFRGAASSSFSLRGPGAAEAPGAAEILEQRLARGEISPEEYRDRLKTLDRTSEPKARTEPKARA